MDTIDKCSSAVYDSIIERMETLLEPHPLDELEAIARKVQLAFEDACDNAGINA